MLTLALVAVLGIVSTVAIVALRGGDWRSSCAPGIAPVDPLATAVAVCAAATLDEWKNRNLMGIGQQLDVHEASGGWFWWAKPQPVTYKALFAELQSRAYAAGVHNLLWAYTANPKNGPEVNDPVELVPAACDQAVRRVHDAMARRPIARVSLSGVIAYGRGGVAGIVSRRTVQPGPEVFSQRR